MFQNLSNKLFAFSERSTPGRIFSLHPAQLQAYLDAVWETWRNLANYPANFTGLAVPGLPFVQRPRSNTGLAAQPVLLEVGLRSRLGIDLEASGFNFDDDPVGRNPILEAVNVVLRELQSTSQPQPFWHHLIYAYLIENTRILEIAGRIVKEAVSGERLRLTFDDSWRWVRNTEELFFKEGSSYYIASNTSRLRPDPAAIRRNAYYRMFGIDLNHGTEDNQPYPYVKPETANLDFVRSWKAFLREVWRGHINRDNVSGAKTTDDNAIKDLAEKLGQMLQDRRGKDRRVLSREEFVAVAAMSWFHLTVAADTAIVTDLKATAATAEERTRRLGEVVGLPFNARSRSFFIMAPPMSEILHALEQGNFTAAGDFYENGGAHTQNMVILMSQWSIATGDDIKSAPVTGPSR